MSNATNNTNTGAHNGHWTATATKSGTYEFATGGKYVDRNIDLVIPQAAETLSASSVTASATIGVGTKDTKTNTYPFTATSGKASGNLTATVGTKGFTDSSSYTGSFSNQTATITANGSMPAVGLGTSVTLDTVSISTVTIGDKVNGKYPITGSGSKSGMSFASVETEGYGTSEFTGDSFTASASLSSTINAASASVTLSAPTTKTTAASPTIAIDAANDNVVASAATTTKPGSGYYVAVKGTAPATTGIAISGTVVVNDDDKGYLGSKDEISVSGTTATAAKTGSTYYVPIQKATVTKGITTVSGTTATRGTYDIAEGYINGTDGDLIAATFKNTATNDGRTYVDISGTTAAPILISGDYLYIDQGYTDNLKISLARLVPDEIKNGNSVVPFAGSAQMLPGYALFDKDGNAVTGTMTVNKQSSLSVDGPTVTVPAGYYETSVSATVEEGDLNNFVIEDKQKNIPVSVNTSSLNSGFYDVSVSELNWSLDVTPGYLDFAEFGGSGGATIGKIVASTTSKTNGTATATANTTHNLTAGTFATSATTGYTYHVDATASASTTAASIGATVGYVGTAINASTTAASSGNKESHIYLLDSTAKVGTTAVSSGSTIAAGSTVTISKGYYPTDRTFKAQGALDALSKQAITGTLSTSITSGYTAPTLVDTAASGTPYITITGNGSMEADKVFNGTANAKTQYLEVYTGIYSVA